MGREEEVVKTLPENHPGSLSGPVFRSSAIPTTCSKSRPLSASLLMYTMARS